MSAERYIPQALQKYLSLLPEDCRDELKPVSAEVLGISRLLHMSKDVGIDQFSPTVTERTSRNENRSVPRICTAPTLAGCIMGYVSDAYDFLQRPTTYSADGKRKIGFRGGWGLYGIPFDYALRPTKKLVPDVERSDEHWLVTYDEENIVYKPELIAKFFYGAIQYEATSRYPKSDVQMLVEVSTDQPIKFDRQNELTRGYWELQVKGLHSARRWDCVPSVVLKQVSQAEYSARKKLVASLLSFQEAVPPSMDW